MDQDDEVVLVVVQLVGKVVVHGDLEVVLVVLKVLLVLVDQARELMVLLDLVQMVVMVEIIMLLSSVFQGGTSGISGQYNGGRGNEDSGDQGGEAGGGGYYGGGGGGASSDASGGGGGSGYYNPLYSSSGSLYNGGVPMWTNNSQRSGMSGSATAGRIVINPFAHDYWVSTLSGNGSDDDEPYGIAVDSEHSVYVTGWSESHGSGDRECCNCQI